MLAYCQGATSWKHARYTILTQKVLQGSFAYNEKVPTYIGYRYVCETFLYITTCKKKLQEPFALRVYIAISTYFTSKNTIKIVFS